METNQPKISVKDLTEEITLLIKEEIVATYTEEEDALQVHFLNGQNFRIKVEEKDILERIKNKNHIVIVNKIDLANKLYLQELPTYIEMSIKDDIGINELRNKIKEIFNLEQIEQNDYTYLSSARSISLLKKSLESLNAVKIGIENNMPVDMVEIDLKQMWSTLGEIIGETYTDELIDQLFSQFCLGK